MFQIEINNQKEWDEHIQIHGDLAKSGFVINGRGVYRLTGKRIISSLTLKDSTLSDLGDVLEVTGNLHVSSYRIKSKLLNLFPLEKVGKKLFLRYSEIESFKSLSYIGDDLNLRDTNLKSFGTLSFVGGNLLLNREHRTLFENSNIEVLGKIRYYKRVRKINHATPNLIDAKNLIYWKKKIVVGAPIFPYNKNHTEVDRSYDSSFLFLSSFPSMSHLFFYDEFKESFLKGIFLNLEGNNNYLFYLFFDLIRDFEHSSEIVKQLKLLGENYPEIKTYSDLKLISSYFKAKSYFKAYETEQKSSPSTLKISELLRYELVGIHKINGETIFNETKSNLTDYGVENKSEMINLLNVFLADFIEENGFNYSFQFFPFTKLPLEYDEVLTVLEKSYINKEFYRNFLDEDEFRIATEGYSANNKNFTGSIVNFAIITDLKRIVRKTENNLRELNGIPKIGEGWISETELFNKLYLSFPNLILHQHASPKWLGRQHLDIYFPEYNIGVEYQGRQHYEPIEFFGGREGFIKTIERDKRKKQLCKENNCYLICVDEGYDFAVIQEKINSFILEKRISD
tara:strand:+ start:275 stop:1978 length:1704 start_codon:yes stop_codon:yes gene_type:complete